MEAGGVEREEDGLGGIVGSFRGLMMRVNPNLGFEELVGWGRRLSEEGDRSGDL